ncbi:hypothetical protein S83_067270 [Arachis hypogaea]
MIVKCRVSVSHPIYQTLYNGDSNWFFFFLHNTKTTVSTVISGHADCIPTGGVSFFSIRGDEFSTVHGCSSFFFRGTYGLKTSN